MDSQKIVTKGKKFTCDECQNENELKEGLKVGDVVECNFCGIEFEIVEITLEGEYVLQIIEEEK